MQDNRSDPDIERQLGAWAASQPVTGISPELQRKLREELRPSLSPVKPIVSRARLGITLGAVFLAGAGALVATVSKTGLYLMTGVQTAAVAAILASCGALFVSKLAGQMIPGSRQVIPVWASLALGGVAAFVGLGVLFPWRAPTGFVSEGWPCALMEISFAVPAAVVFWLLTRRGALFASPGVGAMLAAAGAAVALIPVQSQCMFLQAPHLLLWHLGTAALLIGLGAAAGTLYHRR